MADSLTKLYAGEEAAGFISASLLSGETLAKGNITVLPNVTFKVNLKNFDLSASSVKDASCDFTDAGDITYVEKALTPENFGLNTTATSGEFDGFQVQLAADAAVVDVAGATLSASNIIAELGKVRDAIKDANYGQEDLGIFVGTAAMKYYVSAQGALGYMDQFHAGVTEANFEGTKLILAPGMAADKMVAARKSNLFFATDLASDMAEVKVIDMTENDGSDNVRLVMKWNAGVGYANGSDIVYYA